MLSTFKLVSSFTSNAFYCAFSINNIHSCQSDMNRKTRNGSWNLNHFQGCRFLEKALQKQSALGFGIYLRFNRTFRNLVRFQGVEITGLEVLCKDLTPGPTV